MATRAHSTPIECLIRSYKVPAAKAVTVGFRVKFSGADDMIENCIANEDGIGVALASGVPGDTISVAMEGHSIVPVKVGTGGATRGLYADFAVDGFKDRAIADGATTRYIGGKFLQSGVAGDIVGLLQGCPTPVSNT